MTRTMARLSVTLAFVVAVLAGPLAGTASAHGDDASVASNYRTRILSVTPEIQGVQIDVIDVGGRLRLTNRSDTEVVVLGYEGEPYLRVGPDGVFENRRSPTTYLNLTRSASTPIPADADADARPRWEQISQGQEARWHDHRVHWMGTEPPPTVQATPGSEHVIYQNWTVPLRAGDTEITVAGDLTWVPGPSRWPWLLGALALMVGLALALRTAAWRWIALGALTAAVVLDLAAAAGYATKSPDPPWNSMTLVYPALGVLALWRYVVQVRRGIDHPPLSLLIAGLLLVGISGFDRLEILDQSQLLFSYPAPLARVAVAVSLGAGGALVVTFIAQLRSRQPIPIADEAVEPHG